MRPCKYWQLRGPKHDQPVVFCGFDIAFLSIWTALLLVDLSAEIINGIAGNYVKDCKTSNFEFTGVFF